MSQAFGDWAQRAGGSASEWTDEDVMAARAANAAYSSGDGGLLTNLGIEYAPTGGFQVELTLHRGGFYVLTFAGTDPASMANWTANAKQALGFASTQYEQGIRLAKAVHSHGLVDGNVLFVGHSLGGGIASAAAFATGGRAITFNAAGLHSSHRVRTAGAIRAHYVRGEILTALQQWTPLPNAVGSPIPHSGRRTHGPLRRHFMSSFPSGD